MRSPRALLVILTLTCSCSTQEFVCQIDRECPAGSGYGRCLASHCAYYDPGCPDTNLRFDDTGGSVANQCVDPALLPDAAPTPDADEPDAAETDAPEAADAGPEDAADTDSAGADAVDLDAGADAADLDAAGADAG